MAAVRSDAADPAVLIQVWIARARVLGGGDCPCNVRQMIEIGRNLNQ